MESKNARTVFVAMVGCHRLLHRQATDLASRADPIHPVKPKKTSTVVVQGTPIGVRAEACGDCISLTDIQRDPANAGRRFIPLLLGDCALPDTLRRCKAVDFREESDAAFAKLLSTGPAETGAMKRRFGLPHGARGASKRRRARQSEATKPTTTKPTTIENIA